MKQATRRSAFDEWLDLALETLQWAAVLALLALFAVLTQ